MTNRVYGSGLAATDVATLAAGVARQVADANLPKGALALVASGARALGAASWLHNTKREGLVLGPERWTDNLRAAVAARGMHALELDTGTVWPAQAPKPETPGRVWLLTSGTTGAPKWVAHTWDSLVTLRPEPKLPARHWLLAYQPGTYAWYQVAQLPLFFANQAVTISPDPDPVQQLALAARTGVDAVSTTPTFWRVALLGAGDERLRALGLRQVTLGGERVDQAILDALARLFPQARLSHIYAATEVGAAIVVHDGREGFPTAWLAAAPGAGDVARPRLKIEDGRLWVKSGKAAHGLLDWVDTGDCVELRGDRVVVTGRAGGGMVKVGGATVDLRHVEAVLLQDPAILWCRVTARAAPIVGALLSAEVVGKPGLPLETEAVRARLAGRLADYMVPRFWRVRSEIPAGGNFKTELA